MSINNLSPDEALLIYDSYCYLCSNTIEWIFKLDKAKKIKYINLEDAQNIPALNKLISIYRNSDTVILYYNDKLHIKSDAILEISRITGGWFKIFRIMLILPRRYRNLIYDLVARNRYRFFGKRVSCHLPPSEFTDRYL